jgi:XRE family aerobic/anaerobic benzoate catabolism transcriptional regulator
MKLGDKIREFREVIGVTQGQLAEHASVSQGYLSQLENGDVKNPSAAVLLRVAQAMDVEPDDLFEAAGYPTTRTLRQIYEDYEANVDQGLLRYLARMPKDRQRRLLILLEGIESLLEDSDSDKDNNSRHDKRGDKRVGEESYKQDRVARLSGLQR